MNTTHDQDHVEHEHDYMTVGDLQEVLQGYAPDHLIVLSSDEEGTSFHPCTGLSHNHSLDENGDIGYHHLTPELIEAGFTDEDLTEGPLAIVLWP